MKIANNFFKTRDGQLILAFLVLLTAFVMIMIGIFISEMRICKAALLPLIGALLYSPLRSRVFAKRKNGKSE